MGISHDSDRRRGIAQRFARIAGQALGVQRMVEDERYCIDILHQVAAIRAALRRAEAELLRDHAGHCVAQAIASGDAADQRAKVDELVALFEKSGR